ncbi:hypothetical protein like AT2G06090 [Hibiscus trionum]|uniref:S-protein homolog n=1 Tax=Hibiscus trionum TaxID=183268 RepID=A0A9W7IZS5_HIBTR|nr:hypothetical protein like AT2G06090 [Hibiscus trionum]GMJ04051.1 hypothetical protein like AT2G06090 [Hibiscus trionum]GMJ04052.1 hypothetical protein like AT2G06090 [Hibiscus trionum]
MGISSVNLVFLFVCICLLSHMKDGEAVGDKYTVHITNDLGNNNQLSIHCKSDHSDLGVHVLRESQEFHWTFEVFRLTTYQCNMMGEKHSKTIQVFISNEPFLERCIGECFWSVRDEGFYMKDDRDGKWKLAYTWN